MKQTDLDNFEYVSAVFKGLSLERKDHLLNTARSLLQIQDGALFPAMETDLPACSENLEIALEVIG